MKITVLFRNGAETVYESASYTVSGSWLTINTKNDGTTVLPFDQVYKITVQGYNLGGL